MTISARLEEIRDRVVRAAERAGRDPRDVRLIAVSKTRPPEDVHAALAAGVTELGENKIQEAEAKIPAVAAGEGVRWHFIGHLQKNKARKAVELFDVIHSVDSRAIGERIDRIAGELQKTQPVLVQVDLAGEATKHGVPEAELAETLEALAECRHLRLDGLMVLPPLAGRSGRRPPLLPEAARARRRCAPARVARRRRAVDGNDSRLRDRDRGRRDLRPPRNRDLRPPRQEGAGAARKPPPPLEPAPTGSADH